MGSDFPHAEGLASRPTSPSCSTRYRPTTSSKIMRGNAEALLGAR